MPLTDTEKDELELLTLEEEEHQASQPRSGFGALREAEAGIPSPEPSKPRVPVFTSFPVEPLSADKQTLERQIEQARSEAAGGARILPVVAAGLATGGMGALPAAAAMGFNTGAGELAGEGIEVASGQREKIEPRRVAGAALRGSVPIIGRGGALARGALNYGAQFGSNIGARALEEGRAPTLGEVGIEAATAVPSGLAGAASGFLHPKGTQELQNAARAAEEIKARTGKELPRLVGEVTQDLGTLRGELRAAEAGTPKAATPTDEAMRDGRLAVLLSAAKVGKDADVDAATIANEAKTALEHHIGPLNADVEKTVDDLSKAYTEGKLGTQEDIQNELRSLVPGSSGESRYSLGTTVKKDAEGILSAWKDKVNGLYAKVRENPLFTDPSVVKLDNTKKWVEETAPLAIQRTEGTTGKVTAPISSALPEGTARYLNQLAQAKGTQSVESLKNFRTELMNGVNDANYLPGLGARQKMRLARAVSDDINASLEEIAAKTPAPTRVPPTGKKAQRLQQEDARTLLDDLKTANKEYASRIDDFDNVFAQGVLRDVGERGAATPEALASKLTGSNALSTIQSLKRIYGEQSGPIVEKVHGLIRDEVLGQFTNAATGETNIGGLLNHITNDKAFPRELATEVFPNASEIEALAKRQLKANGLPSTDAAVRGLLEGDKSIADAMTAPNRAATLTAADAAIAANAKREAAMKSTVMRAIASKNGEELVKNPQQLVRGFISGTYTPNDVSEAMTIIRNHNPNAANNLEFSFVENALRNSSEGGKVDVRKLSDSLRAPSGSTEGGTLGATANAVLGKERADNLRKVAELIHEAEAPREGVARTMGKGAMTVRGIAAATLGGAISGLAFGASPRNVLIGAALGAGGGTGARGVQRFSDALKYSIASRLLTDPRLARLTDKAYDSQRLANAVRLAAHSIELESDDDNLREEARKLSEQLK